MIEFKDMPLHSRVWIYQADREFTSSEINSLQEKARAFVAQWTAHDQLMKACIEIFYHRFIVVCVDEKTAPASGCGIDKSVKFIQQLEKIFSVSLLDRMDVAYCNGPSLPLPEKQIQVCSTNDLSSLISQGKITEDIFVFNNLVQTKEELEKNWEAPLKESWYKKFINPP